MTPKQQAVEMIAAEFIAGVNEPGSNSGINYICGTNTRGAQVSVAAYRLCQQIVAYARLPAPPAEARAGKEEV